jgi:hypothetical protein
MRLRYQIRSSPSEPGIGVLLATQFGAITGDSYNAKHETSLELLLTALSPEHRRFTTDGGRDRRAERVTA